jgi:hypothetical protein
MATKCKGAQDDELVYRAIGKQEYRFDIVFWLAKMWNVNHKSMFHKEPHVLPFASDRGVVQWGVGS